jgi:iron-sulfur cluster assembly accessory protein
VISATPEAIRQLRALLAEQPAESARGLRLGVEKGGCAGSQYVMKLDLPAPGDHVIEQEDVRLIVDPESLQLLDGVQLDYVDSLNDAGFRVNNPHAVRSCGCGTSFESSSPSATSTA